MTTTTTPRTADQILAEIAALDGELATLAGRPLEISNGLEGDIRKCPPGGATLSVDLAITNTADSYVYWYPTVEAAQAALAMVALANNRAVDNNGFKVDLTAPGCQESRAYVTRRPK